MSQSLAGRKITYAIDLPQLIDSPNDRTFSWLFTRTKREHRKQGGFTVQFGVYGPFEIHRDRRGVAETKSAKQEFWAGIENQHEGLSQAFGCHVFVIRKRAWYVGRTTRQGFRMECFTEHKVNRYNRALQTVTGPPSLIFIAKQTPSGHFAKLRAGGNSDIKALENLLIGAALARNSKLLNAKDTELWREMRVPGVLNTQRGEARSKSVQSLKRAVGIGSL